MLVDVGAAKSLDDLKNRAKEILDGGTEEKTTPRRHVVMIQTKHLLHHPKNPRLEIGDVTELADSVGKNGIMQNLTVIPAAPEERGYNPQLSDEDLSVFEEHPNEYMDEDGRSNYHMYHVLIGNRRMEAAKAAGLEEVPCVIVGDMPLSDQVAMMMQENMQREDLTIPEEAYGFQMMLDLGDSVKGIAEKTGFSETKVRHRIKIAEIDKDILKDKLEDESFQLSMKDLIELEKVKDPDAKNKILKSAKNSNDMQWRIRSHIKEEEKKKNLEKAKQILEAAGIEHNEKCDAWCPSGYDVLDRISLKEFVEEYAQKEGWEGEAECYGIYPYSMMIILAATEAETENEEPEEDSATTKIRNLCSQMNDKFQEIIDNMHGYGLHAIKNNVITDMMIDKEVLWNTAYKLCPGATIGDAYVGMDDAGYFDDIIAADYEDESEYDKRIAQIVNNTPMWKKLFLIIMTEGLPGKWATVVNTWNGNKDQVVIDKSIDCYNFLHDYDYEYKDEETMRFMRGEGPLWEELDELIKERDKEE